MLRLLGDAREVEAAALGEDDGGAAVAGPSSQGDGAYSELSRSGRGGRANGSADGARGADASGSSACTGEAVGGSVIGERSHSRSGAGSGTGSVGTARTARRRAGGLGLRRRGERHRRRRPRQGRPAGGVIASSPGSRAPARCRGRARAPRTAARASSRRPAVKATMPRSTSSAALIAPPRRPPREPLEQRQRALELLRPPRARRRRAPRSPRAPARPPPRPSAPRPCRTGSAPSATLHRRDERLDLPHHPRGPLAAARSISRVVCLRSSSSSSCSSRIRRSSSSVRPEVAVTVIDCRCPVATSRAETPTMPSALISKVTSISTSPRRAGRRPVEDELAEQLVLDGALALALQHRDPHRGLVVLRRW